ncbi:MAG: sulfite exporter TauE/SafE family protein [Candidatus Thermoplasmatota archaeon]|nr:sulfite exporter TauE/SafE family protein [Candidatus Thermoplasmatota archaeon]MCL5790131.1 sulfite exporter TauE/SafE family protein [Candidatus Thermoplasmatota archaeon]
MIDLNTILNPPEGLSVYFILLIAIILGLLHGATPDEHTWPITFSYSIGSYSTRGGMKSGFVFSAGFTIQRAILTTLGFLGLALIYKKYNLDGYIYVLVGFVMFIVGYYLLKGTDLHVPLDKLFGGHVHHTSKAERLPMQEVESSVKPVPVGMAFVHGFVAGWGFGGFSTIITFILAPQMPNVYYAALVGAFFGLGTMFMQIIIGAIFANIMRVKKLTNNEIKYIGRSTAARTLYLGGIAFGLIGLGVIAFPFLDTLAISTGNPVPNLNSIGIETVLVILVVGVIGLGSFYKGYKEIVKRRPDPVPDGK